MNLIIYTLLVSSLFINLIVDSTTPLAAVRPNIPLWASSGKNILKSSPDKLVLAVGGMITETPLTIIWKGRFNDQLDVAVKMSSYMARWIREIGAYVALDAMSDSSNVKEDIPHVYCHGLISDIHPFIAMTLFDGSLDDLYERYKGDISELQILDIFKKAVHGLKHLQSKNIVHNDIQPKNIFLRGSEILLGDFDMATVDNIPGTGYSEMFASTGYYDNRTRKSRDDLESLVFSMWYIAGIPLGISNDQIQEAEGKVLAREKKAGKGDERVLAQCKHFKNPKVSQAFKDICLSEMLSNENDPNYDSIINILDKAIVEVGKNSKPVQFHWLTASQ